MVKHSSKQDKPGVSVGKPDLALQIVNRYLRWIIVLFILSILFISYEFVIAPQVGKVQSAATDNLPAKERALGDLKVIKKDLDGIIHDFDIIRAQRSDTLERLKLMLPVTSEYEQLYTIVDELVRRSGFALKNISLALEGASDAAQQANFEIKTPDGTRQQIPIQSITMNVTIEGYGYEEFKQLLGAFERNIRLFDIRSLAVDGSAFEIPDSETDPTPATFSFELITYFKPDSL